jgi:hypothetical protein
MRLTVSVTAACGEDRWDCRLKTLIATTNVRALRVVGFSTAVDKEPAGWSIPDLAS